VGVFKLAVTGGGVAAPGALNTLLVGGTSGAASADSRPICIDADARPVVERAAPTP
jgi:hypothetical protein